MAIADLAPDRLPRRYAGFWIRVAAFLLDYVILGIPMILLMVIEDGSTSFMGGGADALEGGGSGLWMLLKYIGPGFWITVALAIAYNAGMQSSTWQATLGKRLMGIYVMRSDGERMTFLRALGRYFAYLLLGFLGCIGCVGYIMAGLTKEKTAAHDLIADTRVVYGKR